MKFSGKILKLGMIDPRVKDLKKRLISLGYGPLTVENPLFGEATDAVVRRFQKDLKLKTDGIVGELTWTRLFEGGMDETVSSPVLKVRAMEYANTQKFVRERTGKNDGGEVEEYLKSIGLGKGYAWCQAFVYWCFEQAAKDLGVPNPVPKTGGVLKHYQETKGQILFRDPEPGDIGIMDFGGGKGHIFFVEENKGERVFTIEGNTNREGSREGDGVYERNRSVNSVKAFIRYV